MPLDPQLAEILAGLAATGSPSIASTTPEAARAMMRLMTVDLRDPATLAAVRSVEDQVVPGPAGDIRIRILRPDVDGPVPTIVFVHGGGWVVGDLDTHEDQTRLLCRDVGAVVVSVDYRLAPEHPFPAGFDDCLAATRWAAANVASLGGDADRLALGGDSAGGNLAAAVALALRDAGPALAAQFLLYPAVDARTTVDYPSMVDNATGYMLTAEDCAWFVGAYLPGGDAGENPASRDLRVSPLLAPSLAGLPPTVIATAEFDPLRDQGEAYAKALADAGVEVQLTRYDGLIHGFYGFGTYCTAAGTAISELNASLRELLSRAPE